MSEVKTYNAGNTKIVFTWVGDDLNETISKSAVELCHQGANWVAADAKRIVMPHRYTGNLANRISTKRGKIGLSWLAWSRAPHSWIVEHGTPTRWPGSKAKKVQRGQKWHFKIGGQWVTVDHVGPMPALHFMAQAAANNEDRILRLFKDGIAAETPIAPVSDNLMANF